MEREHMALPLTRICTGLGPCNIVANGDGGTAYIHTDPAYYGDGPICLTLRGVEARVGVHIVKKDGSWAVADRMRASVFRLDGRDTTPGQRKLVEEKLVVEVGRYLDSTPGQDLLRRGARVVISNTILRKESEAADAAAALRVIEDELVALKRQERALAEGA